MGVPEFKECLDNAPSRDSAAGNPVRSREEDLRILLGPFQREMLCDGASVCVCSDWEQMLSRFCFETALTVKMKEKTKNISLNF